MLLILSLLYITGWVISSSIGIITYVKFCNEDLSITDIIRIAILEFTFMSVMWIPSSLYTIFEKVLKKFLHFINKPIIIKKEN